jgi:hypothetical protein
LDGSDYVETIKNGQGCVWKMTIAKKSDGSNLTWILRKLEARPWRDPKIVLEQTAPGGPIETYAEIIDCSSPEELDAVFERIRVRFDQAKTDEEMRRLF